MLKKKEESWLFMRKQNKRMTKAGMHYYFPSLYVNIHSWCWLYNEFMDISNEKTGWNPSYTISSLLLQVQNFIADPDKEPPSKCYIDQLMKSMENYSRTFLINTEKGIVFSLCSHVRVRNTPQR